MLSLNLLLISLFLLLFYMRSLTVWHSKVGTCPSAGAQLEPRLWSASIGPRWPRWAPRRMAGKLRGCFGMIPSASSLGWRCRMRVHGTGEQINIVVKPETNLTCFFWCFRCCKASLDLYVLYVYGFIMLYHSSFKAPGLGEALRQLQQLQLRVLRCWGEALIRRMGDHTKWGKPW